METTVKQKIGKYEITGILGRGGMGVVYRAEDKRIGRRVAIKTLTEGFSGQPEMLERFYREAQAGILQHPNIVIVYDLGDEDGTPFIVMEFVEGEPLDKLINSGRNISLIDKLSIIEQVCSGLGYAHRRGVVHRDIKPANVIVQPDGHAKIVDFGIARVQSSGVEGGLTRTGNVIGTIHYIAPERLKGQPFDGRSDIFATGVMLYLMLTGQLPFSGEDMTVLQKLVNEPHPPLATYMQQYPPQLDAIVDRALAKDPEQRYSTAEEFAADLHGLSEELKKGQITELFSDAERLASEQQWGRAREVLLQLVRIDPQHAGARQLQGVVQQQLNRLQRAEQVRQLIAESEEAILASRFPEAMNSIDQAIRLDPENEELKARLASAREKKQRYDEISSLMTQADSLGQRGDWTGAAHMIEKALPLDPADTKIRALFAEYSRQAKIAAQQGQIRDLLGKARSELSSRRFTAAIEILREVGKIDPSQQEMETLLETAVSGQEQERRRKLLEQIHAEIENSLAAEDYERAAMLAERAVQQLPNEVSLQQLKGRVDLQAKKVRERQLISSTVTRAQEAFVQSPGEALLIVQKALQELPGEERLLALEASLRQRLKAAEIEQVRARYLREAQDAISKSKFDKAVEVLESYQVEFNDAAGVSELLDLARNELAQQKRRERVGKCISQAQSLIAEGQFDQAIRLLEPASAETQDPSLARLLGEARAAREEVERKIGAAMARIARLRERGQLDEAIEALQALPSAQTPGSQPATLLNEIRAEQARKQATSKALAAATAAIEQGNFQSAIEALESVQRAYGEAPDLTRAISEIEVRRRQIANEAVSAAIGVARGALAANNAADALKELKSVSEQVGYADEGLQADWRRLGAEAAKPRKTGTVAQIGFETGEDEAPKRKMMLPMVGGGVLVVALIVGFVVWNQSQSAKKTDHPQTQPQTGGGDGGTTPPVVNAAPIGTVIIQGKTPDAMVFVDGAIKGFTLKDGTLKFTVDPGQHSIKMVKAGFADYSPAPVTVADKAEVTVPYQLQQATSTTPVDPNGYLTIQSVAGAYVSIDHIPQGNVDSSGILIKPVKAGTHTLDVGKDGYVAASQSFTIKAGDRTSLPVQLAAVVKPVEKPVALPVQALFTSASQSVEQGQAVTLTWQTSNATSVSIDPGVGTVDANGSREVSPTANTTYTLIAKGDAGTLQKSVSIVVTPKVEKQVVVDKPPPPVDETPGVQAALNAYTSALAAHDVARMQAAWPSMKPQEEKLWTNFFKSNSNAKVTETCAPSALSITGDTANWNCTETTTIIISGKATPNSRGYRFSFAKKGGTWTITNRQ